MAPLPAGIDRVVGKVTVEPPAIAATAPVPLQVVLAFGVAAIVIPTGKASVSGAVKVATLMLGLDSVMVRVDTLPAPALMLAGLKALPSLGATELVAPHTEALTTLLSSVTAPVCAIAIPSRVHRLDRDALERENISYECSADTDSRGATDLPPHVAG